MIPLNRPYNSNSGCCEILDKIFEGFNYHLLYSSRDGLNLIYKKLYERYGSLRVLVSPLTCFIALYPIVQNGHIPVFADINPKTLNIDEVKVVQRRDVQVIQIIYLGGNPVQIDPILHWAQINGVIVIEDCAQALGSTYNGKLMGTFGNYAVFSLVKNVFSYAGGVVLSKDDIIPDILKTIPKKVLMYKHLKRWLESRVNKDKYNIANFFYYSLLKIKESGEMNSNIHLCGFNIRDERAIIRKFFSFPAIIEKRLSVTNRMSEEIDDSKFVIQQEVEGAISNRNRLFLVSNNRKAEDIIFDLRKNGIAANNLTQSYLNGFQPHISEDVILSKFYSGKLCGYESVFPRVFSIPNSPALKDREIEYIIKTLNNLN